MGAVPEIRAGIYRRISDDIDGTALGVARQEHDCRALCERNGWSVVEVFTDNDLSASRYSQRPRPAYEAMLTAIKEGRIDAVVAWDQDRLFRRPAELERFFEVCDAAGVRKMATVSGELDLATGDGQFTARILGAVAAKEADNISRRVKRKHEEIAAAGRWAGKRPFGYQIEDGTLVPDPVEFAAIREAADLVLAGEGITAAYRSVKHLPSVQGGRWATATIRQILRSARIAGAREHRGEIVAYDCWPAVVTIEELARLREMLTDRNRVAPRNTRPYLLRGVIFCGGCGGRMQGLTQPRTRADGREVLLRRYYCRKDASGCGKVAVTADQLEPIIVEAVEFRLAQIDPSGIGDGAANRAQLEESLRRLSVDHYVEAVIGRDEFLAAREALLSSLAAIDAVRSVPIVDTFRDAPLLEKRRLIGTVIARVVVAQSRVRGGRFDPDRITVEWR